MDNTSFLYSSFEHPCYVIEENALRKNLKTIKYVSQQTGAEIILAFKAFALWKTFPIFREYINGSTASSLNEVLLSSEYFPDTHTYSPAYTDNEIDLIASKSSHLIFNSLSQYDRYAKRVKATNKNTSIGIRINPQFSTITTELYNPCAEGSRFGVTSEHLTNELPSDIDGFHCHCHCESSAEDFSKTLYHIEKHFSKWFTSIKWINFGGGHLMTREGYKLNELIATLSDFSTRYPHLKIFLEPGSAFAWRTGVLVAHVVDIVENNNIKTAILNVSFTCHMPDCLEMPYMPEVRNAQVVNPTETNLSENCYRLGGCSCLSGDYLGYWRFSHPLSIGETIIFEDMIHYTTVKTNMFNGISHPSIAMLKNNGDIEMLRQYDYNDYKTRMD